MLKLRLLLFLFVASLRSLTMSAEHDALSTLHGCFNQICRFWPSSEGVQKRRKGCSKFEILKQVHFSWQPQFFVILKSDLARSKRLFILWDCRRFWDNFQWQVQGFACLAFIFPTLVTCFHWKIVPSNLFFVSAFVCDSAIQRFKSICPYW